MYLDGNSKVTAGNGDYSNPRPNAFSLRAQAVTDAKVDALYQRYGVMSEEEVATPRDTFGGSDCPGSTPTCRAACYVAGIDEHQTAIYAMYEHNSEEIRRILADEYLANDWVMRMAHWITQNAAGGFRLHVSGDVFSMQYAEWLADLCREAPTVRFWIYSRSLDYLAPLAAVGTKRGGNLSLNISCDKDNIEAAREAASIHDGRLCYLTTDGEVPDHLPDDSVLFPDYPLRMGAKNFAESAWWQSLSKFQRGLVCQVDLQGKSESVRCGLEHCDRCLK